LLAFRVGTNGVGKRVYVVACKSLIRISIPLRDFNIIVMLPMFYCELKKSISGAFLAPIPSLLKN